MRHWFTLILASAFHELPLDFSPLHSLYIPAATHIHYMPRAPPSPSRGTSHPSLHGHFFDRMIYRRPCRAIMLLYILPTLDMRLIFESRRRRPISHFTLWWRHCRFQSAMTWFALSAPLVMHLIFLSFERYHVLWECLPPWVYIMPFILWF